MPKPLTAAEMKAYRAKKRAGGFRHFSGMIREDVFRAIVAATQARGFPNRFAFIEALYDEHPELFKPGDLFDWEEDPKAKG